MSRKKSGRDGGANEKRRPQLLERAVIDHYFARTALFDPLDGKDSLVC